MGLIVNGFIEPVTRTLPMEYAVEWSRLIELQMEGFGRLRPAVSRHAHAGGVQELREPHLRRRRDGAQVQPRPGSGRALALPRRCATATSAGWPTSTGPTARWSTPKTPDGAARARRRLGRRRPRRGRGHRELRRPEVAGRGRARPTSAAASGAASAGAEPTDMSTVDRRAPVARGGDLALQPHRRARPRRLRRRPRRRPPSTGWDGRDAGPAPDEAPADVFAELNAAHAEPCVLRIPAGHVVADPIEVVWAPPGRRHRRVPPPRRRGRRGQPRRRSWSASRPTTCAALVVPVTELHAGDGARLRYVGVNQLGPRVWQIGHQVAPGERDSTSLARHGRPRRRLRPGPHRRPARRAAAPPGDQIAAYFGDGDQMHDFRTLQDHAAPKTTIEPAVQGGGRRTTPAACTPGLIRVRKEAPGTNAFQTNRNLKLSEGAWADERAQPRDREQRRAVQPRLRRRARSTPSSASTSRAAACRPTTAERLIVLGFFDEVLERLPVAAAASAELRAPGRRQARPAGSSHDA